MGICAMTPSPPSLASSLTGGRWHSGFNILKAVSKNTQATHAPPISQRIRYPGKGSDTNPVGSFGVALGFAVSWFFFTRDAMASDGNPCLIHAKCQRHYPEKTRDVGGAGGRHGSGAC